MIIGKTLQPDELHNTQNFDIHEHVYEFIDDELKLHGFIAIHSTNLGPAVGGTRFYPYLSRAEALDDALNLSKAMTYKCAIAGVNFGGAKGVIIGNPYINKNRKILKEYARQVDRLNGKFNTGEDVGITENDVQFMLKYSPYFIGKSDLAGDPSPYAALSVYHSMQAACKSRYGKESLVGRRVAIKGVGKVGGALVGLLSSEDAIITISDIDKKRSRKIANQYPKVREVEPNEIAEQEVDIYSPCAMGGEFTLDTVNKIRAKIICGGANNQLQSEEIGDKLFEQGHTYIPDYVANAGGVINVVDELELGGYKKDRVLRRIIRLKDTVQTILKDSDNNKVATNRVANSMAENIFKNAKNNN